MTGESFSLDTEVEERAAVDPDFQQGLDWQQTGHPEEAAEAFRRSLDADHDSALIWTFYAWALAASRDSHGAIAACRRAIACDAEWGQAWNDLGEYLMDTGRENEALFVIRRALKSRHFDAPHLAQMNLARYYLHQGSMRRALAAAQEAQHLAPGFRPAEKLAQWIDERMQEWNIRD
ncbi:tetratricopeptide repeat protein [Acidithiobacillus thiooxidans]|uniref:tetratricopeptide repeat protein n=1 Tax=Acidithiobacillus TaxID=119977 RepID=UPI00187B0777|nr:MULTISPECIES: tetratricopeptide repeat protein [Acidithiobacillus]MBE7566384.1 tetratricopeptide repeat protein [Acidithiobacillus sp. HP-11]MBU2750384.1 tetratricopeptide repeat protein [Acidithiobacillus thiooxidans]MBU2794223.1 tetratricopeptide repeat protein [Acidithiobacillus thiooxidans]